MYATHQKEPDPAYRRGPNPTVPTKGVIALIIRLIMLKIMTVTKKSETIITSRAAPTGPAESGDMVKIRDSRESQKYWSKHQ